MIVPIERKVFMVDCIECDTAFPLTPAKWGWDEENLTLGVQCPRCGRWEDMTMCTCWIPDEAFEPEGLRKFRRTERMLESFTLSDPPLTVTFVRPLETTGHCWIRIMLHRSTPKEQADDRQ